MGSSISKILIIKIPIPPFSSQTPDSLHIFYQIRSRATMYSGENCNVHIEGCTPSINGFNSVSLGGGDHLQSPIYQLERAGLWNEIRYSEFGEQGV
jgi:hypothetical protein